ncbi:mitochondrial chaperone BCS1 [Eurytemora carolleeae]|uniref:mitochondrial chaperone BCS1 n=1 Tax=Eurytemora carolleeae TaxID=1294199 RepID=UPI000C77DD4B|nr:mitochondrial chaperone BCS1 [Eurytemora carolleeae]|eukprot:XP_023325118.1 mitochondrial chaperone BCS1-like [Eurytemora affinis]
MSQLLSLVEDNPYFGAGFGLMGVGLGATAMRKGAQVGMILFRRHYMTTVEVTCKDKSYSWLLGWISQKGARKTQHLSVDTSFVESDSGKISTKYDFQPSVGTHFMNYQGTWIRVERTREQRMLEPWETVQLTTFGRHRALFVDILEESRQLAMSAMQGKTVMYTVIGTDWRPFGHPRQRRPVSSVVLDTGVSETVLTDVKDFMTSQDWYKERGIPYRRGYLLHGPPGCGKTSFITALAGELEYSICVLNLSDRSMSDDRLAHRLADAPENSIILLEDIDAAFVSREDSKHLEEAYKGLNRLTFSGLLNAIDGVTSTEGRILFMTTNYIERLDPALIRPGRVDIIQYIGYCSQQQLKQMFSRFYPMENDARAEIFASKVCELGIEISAAQVQGYFMWFKKSPQAAIDNVFRFITPQEK